MENVNLEKLIISLCDKDVVGVNIASSIQDALRKQGLTVHNNQIMTIDVDSDECNSIVVNKPMYKENDWICNGGGNPCVVISATPEHYQLQSTLGLTYTKKVEEIDKEYHLWNVYNDAKDGDFIYIQETNDKKYEWIVSFKNLDKDFLYDNFSCCMSTGAIYNYENYNGWGYINDVNEISPAKKDEVDKMFELEKENGFVYNSDDNVFVKRNFNIGDYIIDTTHTPTIYKILNIYDFEYCCEDIFTGKMEYLDFVNNNIEKWSIEKAKDGDIVCTDNFIFIFKNIDYLNGVRYYCAYEKCKHEGDDQFHITGKNSIMGSVGDSYVNYYPAKKEEIMILFDSMASDGYQWNKENREIEKCQHEWKNGDVVRLKNDDGKRYQISLDEEQTPGMWFLCELSDYHVAGGWVSTYFLDCYYVFVNNPVDDAKESAMKEIEKMF